MRNDIRWIVAALFIGVGGCAVGSGPSEPDGKENIASQSQAAGACLEYECSYSCNGLPQAGLGDSPIPGLACSEARTDCTQNCTGTCKAAGPAHCVQSSPPPPPPPGDPGPIFPPIICDDFGCHPE